MQVYRNIRYQGEGEGWKCALDKICIGRLGQSVKDRNSIWYYGRLVWDRISIR